MKQLHILNLYPNEMNVYGDRGNMITLTRRIELWGYEPVVHHHHPGMDLPKTVNIILGGGGEDASQLLIHDDLLRIGAQLHKLANQNVPMLMICGLYQLFGHRFVTSDGQEMRGIGIFDLETAAGPSRLIGNVKAKTAAFGTLYGFENHSGRTRLGKNQQPLAKALPGTGNNGTDNTEGARTRNVFGCYIHGPILPGNPVFADALIGMAVAHAGGDPTKRPAIDDSLTKLTRAAASKRRR